VGDYAYGVIATQGTNCATGAKRQYHPADGFIPSCSATPSAISTSSITATYGDHPTLSAHLQGNGSPLPNRTVEFDLNGTPSGTGVTDASGNASTTTTITLTPGTYSGGLQVRFAGDDAWNASAATADVTVQSDCIPSAITSQPPAHTIDLGGSTTLSIGTTGTAPVTVAWYTADGASVGGGNSLTVSPSWTTAYYAMVSNSCHSVQSSTVTITVRQPATITWAAPASITYGTALSATQLNATPNVPGTFTYTPAAGTILAAGTRTLSLTFTPNDTAHYLAATATQSIVVQKANPTGSWSAPAPITYGTPLSSTQLNGTASIPGTIVYTPPAGTILNAGTQTLSATFTPTDSSNYNSTSGSVSISVLKAAQTINWATPAQVATGTAISATQLNATVSVAGPAAAGAITYDVAAGTVMSAGDHTLTASAAATDNYNAAQRSVVLHVCDYPAITTQPQGAVIGAGGSAHLTLQATNSGTITWYKSDGTLVGTGSIYVSVATTTSYYAIVSNSCSSVQSATITITVCAPPTITAQPAGSSITLGQAATLSIGVAALTAEQIEGGGALFIQWFNVANDVSAGSGNNLLVYPTVTTTYYAKVSNGCGLVRSANATVTVNPPPCTNPTINSQTPNPTITNGNSTTLSVDASSPTAMHYQWYTGTDSNDQTAVGTDSPSFDTGVLTLPGDGQFAMIYRYWVVVSNACGSVRSNYFDVTVAPGNTIDDGD
jgi:hypothetical protein